jgi:hypothetical protein
LPAVTSSLPAVMPSCCWGHLAIRLSLGAHQGVSVDIHRGRNLSVPHQLLLRPERSAGVIEPRTVGVAEGDHLFDRVARATSFAHLYEVVQLRQLFHMHLDGVAVCAR